MATQTSELVSIGTRDGQTLMLRGERLVRQSLVVCLASEDLSRRSKLRAAASGVWIREHRTHWTSALRPIIRQRLRNGRLPSERAARIFGGPGTGGPCDACNRELRVTQLVMELPTLDGRVLFVHGDCFIVWDWERAAMWPTVLGLS